MGGGKEGGPGKGGLRGRAWRDASVVKRAEEVARKGARGGAARRSHAGPPPSGLPKKCARMEGRGKEEEGKGAEDGESCCMAALRVFAPPPPVAVHPNKGEVALFASVALLLGDLGDGEVVLLLLLFCLATGRLATDGWGGREKGARFSCSHCSRHTAHISTMHNAHYCGTLRAPY